MLNKLSIFIAPLVAPLTVALAGILLFLCSASFDAGNDCGPGCAGGLFVTTLILLCVAVILPYFVYVLALFFARAELTRDDVVSFSDVFSTPLKSSLLVAGIVMVAVCITSLSMLNEAVKIILVVLPVITTYCVYCVWWRLALAAQPYDEVDTSPKSNNLGPYNN